MTSIDLMLSRLNDGEIIRQIALPPQSVLQTIDLRDENAFSSRWMQAFRDIESKKIATPLPSELEVLVTKLRETSYLQAFRRWKSSELAACISDDFGLIGDGLALNLNDPWINGLLQAYLEGTIPSGSVSEI